MCVFKCKPKELKSNNPQNDSGHSTKSKKEQHNQWTQTWTVRGISEEITSTYIDDSKYSLQLKPSAN